MHIRSRFVPRACSGNEAGPCAGPASGHPIAHRRRPREHFLNHQQQSAARRQLPAGKDPQTNPRRLRYGSTQLDGGRGRWSTVNREPISHASHSLLCRMTRDFAPGRVFLRIQKEPPHGSVILAQVGTSLRLCEQGTRPMATSHTLESAAVLEARGRRSGTSVTAS
jgi:hypothetical protein